MNTLPRNTPIIASPTTSSSTSSSPTSLAIIRKQTRAVKIGDLTIGDGNPIAVQSMCATNTQDIEATLAQINLLTSHKADIIRIAIDSERDVRALAEMRPKIAARLVVDLQENYRLAEKVAPFVQKLRYNPGHLHHHQKEVPVREKVAYLVNIARSHDLALRIGVNFGSIDPTKKSDNHEGLQAALSSAREHIGYMEDFGFANYVLSIKSSNPNDVIDANKSISEEFPFVPLHLGVTEAGMLPMGEIKTRIAFESLLAAGIGDTVRVSLTLPFSEKFKELEVGRQIIADIYSGRFRSVPRWKQEGLNIISCPSCSRVENEKFVDLAVKIKTLTQFAAKENLTIAVMGCRVNGPGESDDADIGLWCAPKHVNMKIRGELVGAFSYEDILEQVHQKILNLINLGSTPQNNNC